MSGALLSVAATKVGPLVYLALEAGGLCCCVSQVCNNQTVSSWAAPTQRASCKQRTERPPHVSLKEAYVLVLQLLP